MINRSNRQLSPADEALVADVEKRLADPEPTSEGLQRIFDGSNDPIARLHGLRLLADLDAARQERAGIIAAGELMLAEVREERDAARDALRRVEAKLNEVCEILAATQAERDRMRPVVEATQAYRRQDAGGGHLAARYRALFAAVDKYEGSTA